MQIHAYLQFNGNCAEAFKFYETMLGGKIAGIMTYQDAPMDMPDEARGKVMHASMNVAGTLVMGSDAMPNHYRTPSGFSVSISVDALPEVERIFASLSEGGTTTMPLQKTFWAAGFGMCTDRFGIPWMINCESPAS